MKAVSFTNHAKHMLIEREISEDWVKAVLAAPEFVIPDRSDPSRTCAFGKIEVFGDRWLRVVYVETETALRVITMFFDRGMEKRQ